MLRVPMIRQVVPPRGVFNGYKSAPWDHRVFFRSTAVGRYILDIARRGIVEAFDSALRSWDDDGDFLAFQEAWDGPLPKGLRAIVDAMQGSDAGMVFHLKVIERLKVYREAYSAALAPVLREEPGQGAMTRS